MATTTPAVSAQAPTLAVRETEVREWLTYLASDALEGREVFTEGYDKAVAYVARHLADWQLTPLGDDGTFLQAVHERRYRVTRKSTVTITVGGVSRTFRHDEHLDVPLESGGPQSLVLSDILVLAESGRVGTTARDIVGRKDVADRLVIYLPDRPGASLRREAAGDDLDVPTRLVRRAGAAGVLTFTPSLSYGRGASPGRADTRGPAQPTSEITTVDRLDVPVPPSVTADEELFDFLFSGTGEPFSVWRARAENGEPVPERLLAGVTVTFQIDNAFEVLSTRTTTNVVGMVQGRDPVLKDSFVIFAAHLDHVGASRGGNARGRVNTRLDQDGIWNGADDNGSGSVGLMALARTFAAGPTPRRSVLFVWHAGEEEGLLGSRYMVSFPVVPLERVEAMVNIDMIGRNRDDRRSEADTVYAIGADRISTDLHNLLVGVNQSLDRPMRLDFEYNDPRDVQSFYTRSDHYSYADRGIPVAFFFTGTHDDYHANSDSADRIIFPKLLRVADLVYRFGFAVADQPTPLRRDHRGPRAGRGFSGTLETPSQ
jgi:hypothetical protein